MAFMQFGDKSLDLSLPHVMGILNVTPDSFSDGGAFFSLDRALFHVEQMLLDGASIIDVGGESTRPGAQPVSVCEEMDRVVPIVEAIKKRFDTTVSVDTSTAEVIQAAAVAGAGLINDVRALTRVGAIEAAVMSGLPICLMHMRGSPQDMQKAPHYNDVTVDVSSFLRARVDACISVGIKSDAILLDPGIGFGKTVEHNLLLLKNFDYLMALGCPILVGASRKSLVGEVLGLPVEQRLFGSLGVHAMAYANGATIFRVHDVKPHAEMLKLMSAIKGAS